MPYQMHLTMAIIDFRLQFQSFTLNLGFWLMIDGYLIMSELERLTDNFIFLEGPRWHHGQLYVSDMWGKKYIQSIQPELLLN